MKKSILLSILLSLVSMTSSHGMQVSLSLTQKAFKHKERFFSSTNRLNDHHHSPFESFEHKGVVIKRDRFGNLLPQWHTFLENITNKLEVMVTHLKDKCPGKAIIVTVPVMQFGLASNLMEAGFTLHYAKMDGTPQDRAEFIYKNGSPIPTPATAIAGSKIFLRNNKGEILFIHDRNPHLQNMLMIPGGGVDVQEFIEEACVRELKEETGLIVKPQDLDVLAIGNRKNVNPYGMSDTCWYFTADKFEGNVVLQHSEIKEALWAPLDEVLFYGKYKNLTPTLTTMEILQHLYFGSSKSIKIKIPDLRQQLKPAVQRDINDTMDLFLFELSKKPQYLTKE